MIIRAEMPAYHAAVRHVLVDAFGGQQEADLVEALRREGAIATALVAETTGYVCGHLVMSRLRSPPNGLALAPIAVAPARRS